MLSRGPTRARLAPRGRVAATVGRSLGRTLTAHDSARPPERKRVMATTRLQIGPADHGRTMTLDEFREADEVPGYRYELPRGVLEVTESPGRSALAGCEAPAVVCFFRHMMNRSGTDSPRRRRRGMPGLGARDDLRVQSRPRGRLAGHPQGRPGGANPPSLVAEVVSNTGRGARLSHPTRRISHLRHPRILDRRSPAPAGHRPRPRGRRRRRGLGRRAPSAATRC